jgi:hypothetical protein
LDAPFSEEEIHSAIMGSYAAGAPGPDGFSFLFYQSFWDVIKTDFMALVRDFEAGTLDVSRLNYAIITLIPKERNARDINKFRPISLGNCSLKIISKAMTNRIAPIGHRIISKNQTAFIKGRFILESVVAAHEVIHEVHSRNHSGLVLKLDYEKAYDRIDWDFLDEMFKSRGFGSIFRKRIKAILHKSSFCVRINDINSSYFVAGKGLKQGDPISPILFNLVADVFSKILFKAATNHLICGLLPQAIPGGVISLQYADDTIIFLQKDLGMARNLKWLLTCFECMSGMPINYHKSDLLTINVDGDEANLFAQVFGCKLGNFPFTYLGVPLHFSKLRREDLRPVLDKIFNKGIAGWRGKLLSYRGRLILLQACIASIPMYLLSFIKFPKWVIAAINSQMAHFFGTILKIRINIILLIGAL